MRESLKMLQNEYTNCTVKHCHFAHQNFGAENGDSKISNKLLVIGSSKLCFLSSTLSSNFSCCQFVCQNSTILCRVNIGSFEHREKFKYLQRILEGSSE